MSARRSTSSSDYFFERFPWNNRWILFSLALLVACFDFWGGRFLLFPVLFVIPVALMAWNCGLRTALMLGVVLFVIRSAIQYFVWGLPGPMSVVAVNGLVRVFMLFFVTFLVGKLGERTRALRARVRTLEGLLPTCAFCKDIRDESGNWHRMEEYLTSRTEARFSHGVCPQCTQQHYGELLHKEAPVARD